MPCMCIDGRRDRWASRAHVLMQGRGYVTPQDVKSIGMDVLRHRAVSGNIGEGHFLIRGRHAYMMTLNKCASCHKEKGRG